MQESNYVGSSCAYVEVEGQYPVSSSTALHLIFFKTGYFNEPGTKLTYLDRLAGLASEPQESSPAL